VIVREQTRAPRRHELALWLRLYLRFVYILYMCVLFVWGKKAKLPSVGQEGEAPERRSRERSPRAWVKTPSVGEALKRGSKGKAPERG
jgi:hypothetical protein